MISTWAQQMLRLYNKVVSNHNYKFANPTVNNSMYIGTLGI